MKHGTFFIQIIMFHAEHNQSNLEATLKGGGLKKETIQKRNRVQESFQKYN